MTKPKLSAPPGLPSAVREWWDRMVSEFDFAADPAGAALLVQATLQLKRAVQCADELGKSGLFVTDRFGQIREHPALRGERQAVNQFRVLIKALGLDPEETSPPIKGTRNGKATSAG